MGLSLKKTEYMRSENPYDSYRRPFIHTPPVSQFSYIRYISNLMFLQKFLGLHLPTKPLDESMSIFKDLPRKFNHINSLENYVVGLHWV